MHAIKKSLSIFQHSILKLVLVREILALYQHFCSIQTNRTRAYTHVKGISVADRSHL